jgi:hypothetical protein
MELERHREIVGPRPIRDKAAATALIAVLGWIPAVSQGVDGCRDEVGMLSRSTDMPTLANERCRFA